MLISIHINKNFIYIIFFTIVNSILTYIETQLIEIMKISDIFYNLLSNISHIFLIIFYFIEIYESKSKSEEEGNILETIVETINQFFHIKNIFLIIFCLIFKAIYTYNIIVFENKVKDLEIFDIVILFLMLLEIFILKKKNFFSSNFVNECDFYYINLLSDFKS